MVLCLFCTVRALWSTVRLKRLHGEMHVCTFWVPQRPEQLLRVSMTFFLGHFLRGSAFRRDCFRWCRKKLSWAMFVLAVVWPGLKKKPHSWRWWSLCVATQSTVVCCVVLAMRAHENGGTVAGSQNQHALGLYMKKPSRTVASPWDQEEQLITNSCFSVGSRGTTGQSSLEDVRALT